MLAFRPFGAYEARMTRNERKDAINANFATISAVSCDGCAATPPRLESLDDSATNRLGNALPRVTADRTGKIRCEKTAVGTFDGMMSNQSR